MRPPDDQKCDRKDPRVKCVGRWDATLRGDFRYDFTARGWVWAAFAGDYVMVWPFCPWCKAKLPNIGAVYDRLRKGICEEED